MASTIIHRSFSLGLALAATTLAACGSKESSTDSGSTDVVKGETKDGDTVTIKVGASPVPHGDILSFVQNNLTKGSGISLDVVEFTDYVLPNTSLEDGSLAANYFQTPDYLAQQVADKGVQVRLHCRRARGAPGPVLQQVHLRGPDSRGRHHRPEQRPGQPGPGSEAAPAGQAH